MTHATQTPRLAGRREWIGLAVLVLPLLLVSMDMTVLYFAIPSISAALNPSGTEQLWIIDMYGFVLAGLLITMGNVGDRIGRRKLLLIGSVIFGLASVAAAFASDPTTLIVARAIQGVGGATLMPSTLALVRNMFEDEKQRRSAIAVWSTGLSVGAALGPIVSGVLLQFFPWGSVFLINAPVMVLLLILVPTLVPEYRLPKGQAGKFDFASGLLSLAGVLSVIWGLKEAAVNGFSTLPAVALVVGVALGYVFVRRQKTLQHPMIDPQLFRNRDFGASMTVSIACSFCLIGFGIFTTQYMMEVLRMSTLEAALWTMASPVVVTLVVPFVTIVARTVRPAYIIATGFLVAAVGFVVMTQLGVERNLFTVMGGAIGIGMGIAIVLTCITDLVVAAAPKERAGAASALLETGQELGGALGIAILGSVGAAVYGSYFDAHTPQNVPAAAVEASNQTLATASTVAHGLPQAQADSLLAVAREAFTSSLHYSAIAGGIVAVGAAIFTIALLRRIKPTPPAPQDENKTEETKVLQSTVA
ncbi:MFS transporter [Kutzneria sp. 744]|uniref:MFS transporter n=1 Tax=Kutzneria sp. (strain 744) TaxID=345341 RepID=UPI0003EEB7AE|nr:MFS transporter [Kutzneria sp. 744]EWM13273.1 drug resistance transporter [Kutzneria sp. 744]